VQQLEAMKKKYLNVNGDKSQTPKDSLTSITIVIHGIHSSEQAMEMETIIRVFQHCLHIVVITTPELLHQVSRNSHSIMQHIYTLAVSAMGMVSHSADPAALRWFNQVFTSTVLQEVVDSTWPGIVLPGA
jgi:hypothetical protein